MMDCIINIHVPNAIWTLKMATTAGDTIVARISIYIIVPNKGTASIVVDRSWFSVSSWEQDMRMCLEQIVKENDAIVESRIRMTRYTDATETERRVWDVLSWILEIPGR